MQQYANSNNVNSTSTTVQCNLSEPTFTVTRAPLSSSAPSLSYEDWHCRLFGYQPRYEDWHCRLFGYQPSVSNVLGKRTTNHLGKGLKKKTKPAAAQLCGRKQVAILCQTNPTRVPDTKERMLMAKLGLCNVETDDDEELELLTHDVKVRFSKVSPVKLLIIISYIIIYEWYVTAI